MTCETLWESDMKDSVTDFVARLTSGSPELTEVYRQHVADQGELLPHVLMGEITRFVVASVGNEHADWLPGLLRRIEAGLLSGDGDIAELIGVSFVENLSGENAALKNLVPVMGEALRREVRSICGV
jgi:hypothetical protein